MAGRLVARELAKNGTQMWYVMQQLQATCQQAAKAEKWCISAQLESVNAQLPKLEDKREGKQTAWQCWGVVDKQGCQWLVPASAAPCTTHAGKLSAMQSARLLMAGFGYWSAASTCT
jgi:hypothetical protein